MHSERFEAAWLERRESVDHRSRSEALLRPLARAWRQHRWSRVLDLGAGTGSNLRYVAPRLPGAQVWTLLDHDADLLDRAVAPLGVATVHRRPGDLEREGLAAVAGQHLVTASALLDLVSERWMRRLVAVCRSAGSGVLLALSYDGRIEWSPVDEDDDRIQRLVNEDQARNKGMGPALGPEAGATAGQLFRAAGYRTSLHASPWNLGAGDARLATALVDGWERAALGVAGSPADTERVRAWAARRRETIARRSFALEVGHVDLLALPESP